MKKVMLHVESVQRDEAGAPESIVLDTPGTAGTRGGADFLSYEETELTGMAGTRTTLFFRKGAVTLVRTGAYMQRQEFRLGEETHSALRTPLGVMDIAVRTKEIENTLRGGAGSLRVVYDVEVKNLFSHVNELLIKVREDTGIYGSQG